MMSYGRYAGTSKKLMRARARERERDRDRDRDTDREGVDGE